MLDACSPIDVRGVSSAASQLQPQWKKGDEGVLETGEEGSTCGFEVGGGACHRGFFEQPFNWNHVRHEVCKPPGLDERMDDRKWACPGARLQLSGRFDDDQIPGITLFRRRGFQQRPVQHRRFAPSVPASQCDWQALVTSSTAGIERLEENVPWAHTIANSVDPSCGSSSYHGPVGVSGNGLLDSLGFPTYMRPGVALKVRWRQLTPPVPGGTGHLALWTLVLHMSEMLQPSKTGGWDETLHLADTQRWAWLAAPLARGYSSWLRSNVQDLPIANFSLRCWTETFRKALRSLGVPAKTCENFVLYMIRHGGAADDCATENRDLPSIKKRGAWRTDTSVARYSKSARINQQVMALSKKTRDAAAALQKLLPDLLSAGL